MREHEKKYIDSEIMVIQQEQLYYFRSGWNYYDWFIYGLLLITIVLHLIPVAMYELNRGNPVFGIIEGILSNDVTEVPPTTTTGIFIETNNETGLPIRPLTTMTCTGDLDQSFCDKILYINSFQSQFFAITMVILFVRILKLLRVTKFMGAFIVIISKMLWDLLKFVVLYLIRCHIDARLDKFVFPYSVYNYGVVGSMFKLIFKLLSTGVLAFFDGFRTIFPVENDYENPGPNSAFRNRHFQMDKCSILAFFRQNHNYVRNSKIKKIKNPLFCIIP